MVFLIDSFFDHHQEKAYDKEFFHFRFSQYGSIVQIE